MAVIRLPRPDIADLNELYPVLLSKTQLMVVRSIIDDRPLWAATYGHSLTESEAYLFGSSVLDRLRFVTFDEVLEAYENVEDSDLTISVNVSCGCCGDGGIGGGQSAATQQDLADLQTYIDENDVPMDTDPIEALPNGFTSPYDYRCRLTEYSFNQWLDFINQALDVFATSGFEGGVASVLTNGKYLYNQGNLASWLKFGGTVATALVFILLVGGSEKLLKSAKQWLINHETALKLAMLSATSPDDASRQYKAVLDKAPAYLHPLFWVMWKASDWNSLEDMTVAIPDSVVCSHNQYTIDTGTRGTWYLGGTPVSIAYSGLTYTNVPYDAAGFGYYESSLLLTPNWTLGSLSFDKPPVAAYNGGQALEAVRAYLDGQLVYASSPGQPLTQADIDNLVGGTYSLVKLFSGNDVVWSVGVL